MILIKKLHGLTGPIEGNKRKQPIDVKRLVASEDNRDQDF